jgi:hypothetical protein
MDLFSSGLFQLFFSLVLGFMSLLDFWMEPGQMFVHLVDVEITKL